MPEPPYRIFAELRRIAGEIESQFLVVGGHAVGFYGVPRETADVDIVVAEESVRQWVEGLESLEYGVYHRHPNFVQLRHVPGREWPVDLILVNADTFTKMANDGVESIVGGLPLPLPSLRHLLAMKVHALKQGMAHRYVKDFQDVQFMIQKNAIDLGSADIRELFLKFGTEDIYRQVCHACGMSS